MYKKGKSSEGRDNFGSGRGERDRIGQGNEVPLPRRRIEEECGSCGQWKRNHQQILACSPTVPKYATCGPDHDALLSCAKVASANRGTDHDDFLSFLTFP